VYSKRKALRNNSDKKSLSEEDIGEANVREDSPNLNYQANMNDERLGNINHFTEKMNDEQMLIE